MSSTTPMMKQYLDIKKNHKDALLFYRLGDFYELFYDDAVIASRDLGITLTKRGGDIPMCGVPAESYQPYLHKLIQKGHKVALCEQVEKPSAGQKAPLRREVIRVITPGTLLEESLLSEKPNYLVVCSRVQKGKIGMAICELSTAYIKVESFEAGLLGSFLARYNPSEILLAASLMEKSSANNGNIVDKDNGLLEWRRRITTLPDCRFDHKNAVLHITNHFKIADPAVIGVDSPLEQEALGVLLDYLKLTQKSSLDHLTKVEKNNFEFMVLDSSTWKHLELTQTIDGKQEGSFVDKINKTLTASGYRLLLSRLRAPFVDKQKINESLEKVEFYVENSLIRQNVRTILKDMPDAERCLGRLSLNRGDSKDIIKVKEMLRISMAIDQSLNKESNPASEEVFALIEETLSDHPPTIKPGFSETLDEYRKWQNQGRDYISDLEAKYKSKTNANTLKIKFNNIWGYFIEVSAKTNLPEQFMHKQTLSTVKRYVTNELVEIQEKIFKAKELEGELVEKILSDLKEKILLHIDELKQINCELAHIDLYSSWAELAVECKYTKPEVDNSGIFEVIGGRHPVLDYDQFTKNDCYFDEEIFFNILTGPNMGGKSTYLRQNALIAILAQMGSYVPAEKAHLGIMDRVMSRVGASDNISAAQSTFMVEMIETASILHQATKKSLVILDEIGRGTATNDGLAIARAVAEYLLENNQCKVIFATHYHELSDLASKHLKHSKVEVCEWGDRIVFLHKIVEGMAEKSYGIYVAEKAGLPAEVIKRAKNYLKFLETKGQLQIKVG